MNEQKINVKSTYVATVKKDVVNNALSFYANKKEDSVFSNGSVFPEMTNAMPEVPAIDVAPNITPEVVSLSESKVEDTVTIPEELKIDNTVSVEEPVLSNSVLEPVNNVQSVQTGELPGIPNLNVLNPIPEEPVTVNPEPVAASQIVPPMVEPVANPIPQPMPSVPPVESPQPIPNPVPESVIPTPINDNFTNIESMVNQVSENPIRFDASKETNLLGALSGGQSSVGNMPVTPDNLNVVREFGVDEPVTTGDGGSAPMSKPVAGFVNSKILLILVIIFFLASCVFLGYEIYKYVTLPK